MSNKRTLENASHTQSAKTNPRCEQCGAKAKRLHPVCPKTHGWKSLTQARLRCDECSVCDLCGLPLTTDPKEAFRLKSDQYIPVFERSEDHIWTSFYYPEDERHQMACPDCATFCTSCGMFHETDNDFQDVPSPDGDYFCRWTCAQCSGPTKNADDRHQHPSSDHVYCTKCVIEGRFDEDSDEDAEWTELRNNIVAAAK